MFARMLDPIARACGWLSRLLAAAERRLSFCPDCGRNRYYGEPCK